LCALVGTNKELDNINALNNHEEQKLWLNIETTLTYCDAV